MGRMMGWCQINFRCLSSLIDDVKQAICGWLACCFRTLYVSGSRNYSNEAYMLYLKQNLLSTYHTSINVKVHNSLLRWNGLNLNRWQSSNQIAQIKTACTQQTNQNQPKYDVDWCHRSHKIKVVFKLQTAFDRQYHTFDLSSDYYFTSIHSTRIVVWCNNGGCFFQQSFELCDDVVE